MSLENFFLCLIILLAISPHPYIQLQPSQALKAAMRCSLNSSGTQGMCDLIILDESGFVRRHLPQSSSKEKTVLLCSFSRQNSPGNLAGKEWGKGVCLKSHGGQANSLVTGKRGTLLLIFKKGRKQDPGATVSSSLCLGRSWTRSSWKQCSGTHKTRRCPACAWLHWGQILPDPSGESGIFGDKGCRALGL